MENSATESATIIEELARLDPMEVVEPFQVYSSDFAPQWVSQYRREKQSAD